MRRPNEVDFFEAMEILAVPEEVLGKLVEEGKLKARWADGTLYFLVEDIKGLIDRQTEEIRSKAAS